MKISIIEKLQNINSVSKNFYKIPRLYVGVGEYMLSSVEKNFQLSGRPEKWKRLSPATLKKRTSGKSRRIRRSINGNKILIQSARLKNSISYTPTRTKVFIGTNILYAAIHQFGGYAGRGRKVYIPARPYLLIQNEDRQWIFNLFQREIFEK